MKKYIVTSDWEIIKTKSSEMVGDDKLFVGSRSECEEFIKQNKPAAVSQDAQPEKPQEEKPLTVAQIFNVSPDETRTTQESKHTPVKAVKAWGAKNRK